MYLQTCWCRDPDRCKLDLVSPAATVGSAQVCTAEQSCHTHPSHWLAGSCTLDLGPAQFVAGEKKVFFIGLGVSSSLYVF